MKLNVSRVDLWAASMKDRPGGLAEKLAALAQAGADLDLVIARRAPEKPGTGVVFVSPVTGAKQIRSAKKAGFKKSASIQAVRVVGPNKAGLGAQLTQQLAAVSVTGLVPAAVLFEDPTNGHTVADEYAIIMAPPLPNFGERSEPVDVVIEMPNATGSALLKLATAISA